MNETPNKWRPMERPCSDTVTCLWQWLYPRCAGQLCLFSWVRTVYISNFKLPHMARSDRHLLFNTWHYRGIHNFMLRTIHSQKNIKYVHTVRIKHSAYTIHHSFIHSFIHSYSTLEAGLAGTRAQSCDRCGSGTLHPGQVLGGSLPLFSPAFTRSHFRRQVPVRPQRRDRS